MWEHFDLISPKKVDCLICAQELAFSNNTSSKHPETTPNTAAAPAAAVTAAGGATVQSHQEIYK